jgi:hypothetical protein
LQLRGWIICPFVTSVDNCFDHVNKNQWAIARNEESKASALFFKVRAPLLFVQQAKPGVLEQLRASLRRKEGSFLLLTLFLSARERASETYRATTNRPWRDCSLVECRFLLLPSSIERTSGVLKERAEDTYQGMT